MPCCTNWFSAIWRLGCTGYCPIRPSFEGTRAPVLNCELVAASSYVTIAMAFFIFYIIQSRHRIAGWIILYGAITSSLIVLTSRHHVYDECTRTTRRLNNAFDMVQQYRNHPPSIYDAQITENCHRANDDLLSALELYAQGMINAYRRAFLGVVMYLD
jgi:hypothetical protein